MGNIEYIERYFNGTNTDPEKQQFEKKIMEDASFAEEVAFYLSASGLIRERLQEEKKQRFREIYEQQKVVPLTLPVKKLWQYMAAASVIVIVVVISWFFTADRTSPKQLANEYIQQNWQTLPVTMGNQDSLQEGLSLLNSKKPGEALLIFESLLQTDNTNSDAKKYAGITSLRLGNYDKALQYFTLLEADSSFSNPGTFYKAITLLQRNKSGDQDAAKLLLQQVVVNDLEGKNEAQEWLKKIE